MANYAYIRVAIAGTQEARIEAFERVLKLCVLKTLDERWNVRLTAHEDGGPVWDISLPDTLDAFTNEPIGFVVALHRRAIAFRHCNLDQFPSWAQGRVEEEIADYFGMGVYFDATDRTKKPGTREYRVGKTYREWVAYAYRDSEAALKRAEATTPKGHW